MRDFTGIEVSWQRVSRWGFGLLLLMPQHNTQESQTSLPTSSTTTMDASFVPPLPPSHEEIPPPSPFLEVLPLQPASEAIVSHHVINAEVKLGAVFLLPHRRDLKREMSTTQNAVHKPERRPSSIDGSLSPWQGASKDNFRSPSIGRGKRQ
ncbi:hypothetical protein BDV97DRAFT_167603 [Delphinella strobiligena]|nr:hypothetical protein BDV97DRAFT_167603 [Delphinella strobiligena]